MEYLKPIWKDCKVYFPLRKYAVDYLEPEPPGLDILNKDLGSDTFDNSTYIISNGGRGWEAPVVLKCLLPIS